MWEDIKLNHNNIGLLKSDLKNKNFSIAKLYSSGEKAKKILKIINSKYIWSTPRQKKLQEIQINEKKINFTLAVWFQRI